MHTLPAPPFKGMGKLIHIAASVSYTHLFIRGLLGDGLKTNDALEFAVLTGCLRVSKESIFTGLNNFKILSITDTRFDEQFGFTDREVKDLLSYYNVEDKFKETKEWYDGYRFGNVDIYCPWDVINYVDSIKDDPCLLYTSKRSK